MRYYVGANPTKGYKGEQVEVKRHGSIVEYNNLLDDLPSRYITQKMMMEVLKKPLTDPLFASMVKADNLWWLQKKMRKGSWAAKCVEWDGYYRAQKGKGKTLRVRRVKPITLLYYHRYEDVEHVRGNNEPIHTTIEGI